MNSENEQTLDPIHETKRITWIGLGINLFLTAVKFITGIAGSSQAVIADAFHSLSDIITDVAVLLGVRYWTAPADEDHPYGHSRIETIITAFIALALFTVGAGIGWNAISTIRDADVVRPGLIAVIGAAFSIVLKEYLYHWTVRIGKSIKSQALIANAWHHRSDAFSSIPALIAVLLASLLPGLAFIDHLGAFIVSLFIIKVSWDLIKPTLSELTDRGADQRDIERIKTIALEVEGVKEVHAIRSRRHGSGFFLDLHVLVDDDKTVRDGHEITRNVKQRLLERGPDIIDVVIHLEPFLACTRTLKR
jgi:cation diffusion facilitator family transporter